MKYILLSDERMVLEIIPEENPVLPGIPLSRRYSATFLARLLPVEDDVEVEQNWVYDAETGSFAAPAEEASDELTAEEALTIITGEAE